MKAMVHVETKVRLPFLWGRSVFRKKSWSKVNLIVGPNGSGKTLLAESLAEQFRAAGFGTFFLHSERGNQEELLEILRTDSAVREKIAAVLSGMFGKAIRFEERAGGSVVPIVENRNMGLEYSLNDGECHGLREIITLLVALYGTGGCLVIDEPELHLHPQFQLYFMNEIRRVSAENPDRIFILITHSPFFIDLRFPEDLVGVVVCHINRAPTHIESLSPDDELLFQRFLPRFNTYHKQFFFSDNQIFVEGYTDQQMFSALLGLVGGASAGTGIIDVGGKDELGVFCKVCSLLGTDGRIISDLDSLFSGKLRDVMCADRRVAEWLERQYEKQLPFYRSLFSSKELKTAVTMDRLICRLELFLVSIGNSVCGMKGQLPDEISLFAEKVRSLAERHENVEGLDTYKTVILQGVAGLGERLSEFLPLPLAATVPLVRNLASLVTAAAESARIYILPAGCIEHYYTQNRISYMPVSGKDRLFHAELMHILETKPDSLRGEYPGLVSVLERACSLSV